MKKYILNIPKLLLSSILAFLIFNTVEAQNIPILLSPENNSRYVPTQKLRLTWFESTGAKTFQVQVATSPSFTPQTVKFDFVRNSNEIVLSDLPNNTNYWWRVRVSDSDIWSETWKFTTTVLPRQVKAIRPVNRSNNQNPDIIIFEWEKDSANVKYNFQLSSNPGFPDTLRNVFVNTDSTEITYLASGRLYYWRIKSYNIDDVPGQWSEVYSFKTQLPKASLIFPTNFSGNQDTSLTFRWAKVEIASMYDFQISFSDSFKLGDIIENRSTPYTQIKVNSLLSDTIYYWRIKARNAFQDTSRWSEPFAFKTKLSKPTLAEPSNKSRNHENQVLLKWNATKLFDLYRVQVATDTIFTKIISDSYTENTSTKILNLKYNTRYYWRVNTRNAIGDSSSWAKYFSFKTRLIQPELISPENNSVQLSGDSKFYWSKVDSAEFYYFQFTEDSLFSSNQIDKSVKETFIEVKSLSANKQYFWRVRAANSFSDTSLWSKPFRLNTSVFTFPRMSIDTTINFSTLAVDTVATFVIKNNSSSLAVIDTIFASPDTLFKVDKNFLSIQPNGFGTLKIIADTSIIKTGLYSGYIGLIKSLSEFEDTVKIPVKLFSQKAVATISIDTLAFDTTNSVIPSNKNFMLSNRLGNVTLSLKEIKIEGRDAKAYKLLTEIKNINARDSVALTIKFDPVRLDSNIAVLVVKSNSYPNNYLRLPITGIGKGGLLSESTITQFSNFKNNLLYGLTEKQKSVILKNEGNQQLEINFGLVKNYFRIIRQSNENIKLQPGDTASIKLLYITPNFDSLNIDTLYVYHTGIGKKLLKYALKGSFDSTKAVKLIISKLKIDDKNLDQVIDGFTVPQNTSIVSKLTSELFADETNLDFRIGYYTGGPGTKLRSVKSIDKKFIIPYQNVDQRGLVFKGEIFTGGAANQLIDSITVFDLIDVQVLLNKFRTSDILVPASIPAESPDKADVNWVLFGYPFEQISSDSVFKNLDKPNKMEDGKWVVYKYNGEEFSFADQSFLTAGKAYFMAQAVSQQLNLAYTYNNTVTTRKLSDDIVKLETGIWKTFTSPYTFVVEVDTPAVIYRYDTNSKSYRLTNIMLPGEGYFIPPQIDELHLKTFGEYFPVLFPKLISDSDWHLTLRASDNFKNEELFVIPAKSNTLQKTNSDNLLYLQAPKVDTYFDFYLTGRDEQKYTTGITREGFNRKWSVVLKSISTEEISVQINHYGNFPQHFNYVLIDDQNNRIANNNLLLGKNEIKNFTLLVGTNEYINEQMISLNSTAKLEFRLEQNYPNPFNPSTTIEYTIPNSELGDRNSVFVSLIVYDILGREVAALINEPQKPGIYKVEFNSCRLSSGIYFSKLSAGSFTSTKKMIILK